MFRQIEGALTGNNIMTHPERQCPGPETLSPERLFHVKEEMEKAEARRLQPYFVRSFFLKASRPWAAPSKRKRPTAMRLIGCPRGSGIEIESLPGAIAGINPPYSSGTNVLLYQGGIRPMDSLAWPWPAYPPGASLMLALSDVYWNRTPPAASGHHPGGSDR